MNLSGKPGNFPTLDLAAKIDIGDKRIVFVPLGLQQGDRFFA